MLDDSRKKILKNEIKKDIKDFELSVPKKFEGRYKGQRYRFYR